MIDTLFYSVALLLLLHDLYNFHCHPLPLLFSFSWDGVLRRHAQCFSRHVKLWISSFVQVIFDYNASPTIRLTYNTPHLQYASPTIRNITEGHKLWRSVIFRIVGVALLWPPLIYILSLAQDWKFPHRYIYQCRIGFFTISCQLHNLVLRVSSRASPYPKASLLLLKPRVNNYLTFAVYRWTPILLHSFRVLSPKFPNISPSNSFMTLLC